MPKSDEELGRALRHSSQQVNLAEDAEREKHTSNKAVAIFLAIIAGVLIAVALMWMAGVL
jgi:hypothetical protein